MVPQEPQATKVLQVMPVTQVLMVLAVRPGQRELPVTKEQQATQVMLALMARVVPEEPAV